MSRSFGSASEALSWASGYLVREGTQPNITFNYDSLEPLTKKSMGAVAERKTKKRREESALYRLVSRTTRLFSKDAVPMKDAQSNALTIVAVTNRVHPVEAQMMFRYLFGDHSENSSLALWLLDALVRQDIFKDRHPYVIGNVIAQLLRRQRAWAHQQRSKVNVDDLAKLYRMNQKRFKQQYVRPLEEVMRIWQDQADRQITDALIGKGLI